MNNTSTKTLPMDELCPIIEEVVSKGGRFNLITAGTSMLPLLRNRKDTVVLEAKRGRLKKYDIPLFRTCDGRYLLHRVVKVLDNSYNTCGDNRIKIEKGIRDDDIIAVVHSVIREGREISFDSFGYKLYVRVWCSFMPLKFLLTRFVGVIRKFHDFS